MIKYKNKETVINQDVAVERCCDRCGEKTSTCEHAMLVDSDRDPRAARFDLCYDCFNDVCDEIVEYATIPKQARPGMKLTFQGKEYLVYRVDRNEIKSELHDIFVVDEDGFQMTIRSDFLPANEE